LSDVFSPDIDNIKEKGLFRELRPVSPAPAGRVLIAGKEYVNFSSNDYLGLASHPQVKKAAALAAEKYGAGGTSSRLLGGTFEVHALLESALASLKRQEAALVYPSGFQANIGIISSVVSDGDCVIMDSFNHASLWDGAKLSGARIFIYAHRDLNSLEKVLARAKDYRRKLIVTDSLFSMDGDIAPLRGIAELAASHGALTMIDEAHSTGVFGVSGSGLAEELGVEKKIDIVMGTLSKALGAQGGFVCGSKKLIEYLVNKSRSFIYSTALSPVTAAAALKAVELIGTEPARRKKLLENAASLRKTFAARGFDISGSESQIIPVVMGSVEKTAALSEKLFMAGMLAPAIRPPTVPEEKCRIRISLTSEHSLEDINKMAAVIA